MMKLNNNNNSKDAKKKLIDMFNISHKILKEGDVLNMTKDLGISNWDIYEVIKSINVNNLDNVKPSLPTNIYDNMKVNISPDQHPYFESYLQDIDTNPDSVIDKRFETLYKRWKDLKYNCNILDDTIYVESIDKSRFFIIDKNSFTIKSNNDKGVNLTVFVLILIVDTINYLFDKDRLPI